MVGDSTTTTKELAASTLATAVAASGTASISLTDNADGTVTITASTAGNEGNYIIFSETGANISMDGSGYLGGTTLGKQGYRAFANDIISGGGFDFTTDYYNPGSPIGFAPTLAGYTGSGSEVRSYFYSFVSRYGEEGPGSTIAEVTDYASGRMQINDIQYPNGDDHLTDAVGTNYPTVRVYRTDSTASTTDFYEVCEAYWFSLPVLGMLDILLRVKLLQ